MDYFKAVGIRLLRGRVFTAQEWLDTADKAVITETLVSAYFPGEDPIGKRPRISDRESYEIIGIVADTRQNLATLPEPMMYFPLFKGTYSFATLMIRASRDPNLLSLPIQNEMRILDSDLPAVTVRMSTFAHRSCTTLSRRCATCQRTPDGSTTYATRRPQGCIAGDRGAATPN